MKKFKFLLPLFLLPILCLGQSNPGAHRIGQVIVKGNGITANIAPYASIKVCVVGTQCNTIAPVYSDQTLTHLLPQPLSASASGNYDYYIPTGCVDEQISSPGQGTMFIQHVCPSNGTGAINFCLITGCTFTGNVTAPVFNTTLFPYYEINGTQISSSALSDVASLIKSNPAAAQTVTQPANSSFNFITSGTGLLQNNGNTVLNTTTGVQLNPSAAQTIIQPSSTVLDINN
jgi:hypothetical protein